MILAPSGRPAREELRVQNFSEAFESARRGGYKAWFYFPSLDPVDQMTQFTREESAKKLNWAYNNLPPCRLVVDGLSLDEVDAGIWPRATTSNPAFNKVVTDLWDEEAGDARFFDEAAIENCYTQQLAIRRNIYVFGELFGQMLRPDAGSNQATLHTIPMWQVGNSNSVSQDDSWIDGTRANKFGRVQFYRVFTNKDRTQWMDVPADEMIHFHDDFWKGQRRGMSCLTAAVRKLFSMDDLDRAATSGELLRQRLGYQITRSMGDDTDPTLIPGGRLAETLEIENPDGTKSKLHVQRIRSMDGSDIDIADMPPGREIKMVESTKQGAARELSDHMLRDIARCTPYPPEYVFFLGDIGQGTLTRMVQKRVQRIKNKVRQFQIIPQFWRNIYPFKVWHWIKAGRFAGVEGGVPADWYKARFILPADDSVDIGREGILYDGRVDSGKMPRSVYFGMQNEDAEDAEDEIMDERERILKKLEDRRAGLEGRAPDYSQIADDMSYDKIFKESKITERVTETPADLEDNPPTPAPPPTKKNGAARNGHVAAGRHIPVQRLLI